jgi:hypothetical protein
MNLTHTVRNLPARAITALVQAYRYGISPLLPPRCRFAPTCSEYALEAVNRHGALSGLRLALGRILRCHPWGGSGYDPVPCSHDLVQHSKKNGRANAPTLEA